MRVLAMADWGEAYNSGSIEAYDKVKPDIVVMSGDYDEDEAWDKLRKPGTSHTKFYRTRPKFELEHKYDFLYKFITHAGKKSKVFVIRGNHEEPDSSVAAKYYDSKRIDSIPGCKELSGKLAKVDGISILGLGFRDSYFNARLQKLLKQYSGTKIDLLLVHCRWGRLKAFAPFKPRLIVRGHVNQGPAKYLANGAPVVSAGVLGYAVVDFNKDGTIEISTHEPKYEASEKDWFAANNEKKWLSPMTEASIRR